MKGIIWLQYFNKVKVDNTLKLLWIHARMNATSHRRIHLTIWIRRTCIMMMMDFTHRTGFSLIVRRHPFVIQCKRECVTRWWIIAPATATCGDVNSPVIISPGPNKAFVSDFQRNPKVFRKILICGRRKII